MVFYVICSVVGFILVLGLILPNSYQKKRNAFFEGREVLSWDQIFLEYFKDSVTNEHRAFEYWSLIAWGFSIDPGLLRPKDSFEDVLGPIDHDWDDLDELFMSLYDDLEFYSADVDLNYFKNVESIIIFFANLEPSFEDDF